MSLFNYILKSSPENAFRIVKMETMSHRRVTVVPRICVIHISFRRVTEESGKKSLTVPITEKNSD